MKILRLLLGRRGTTGRGTSPAVEAALRAKRARDHLARKRRRDGWEARDESLGAVDAEADAEADDERAPDLDALSAEGLAGEAMPAAPRSAAATARTKAPETKALEPAPFELEPPRAAGGGRRAAAPSSAPSKSSSSPSSSTSSARASNRPTDRRRRATRRATPRGSSTRAVGPVKTLPRLVVPGCTLLALGVGFALGRPLFERVWLPRVPFTRVAVVGATVRDPMTIARALLAQAGAPLDRLTPDGIRAVVLSDPWLASADSLRLPDGTLLLRVSERHAVARYRASADEPVALVDPEGHRFLGDVTEGGALPLIDGPVASDASLPPATLEILAELRKHTGLSTDSSALILHLPLADETGYVLELGEEGPRALLGQTYLKRRVARLASLLEQRDRLLAGARVIDLRYADRAVLRTEPTSG